MASEMAAAGLDQVKNTAPGKLVACVRVSNIIIACLLITSSVITFKLLVECNQSDCYTFSISILAAYCILFSLLMLVFELRFSGTSRGGIRKNCGFMFSYRGQALLLFFLASLCFSTIYRDLGGLWWFAILAGSVTTIAGIFLCILIFLHPSFDDFASSKMETALRDAESQMTAHIGSHTPAHSNYEFGADDGFAYDQQVTRNASSTPFAQDSHPFSRV